MASFFPITGTISQIEPMQSSSNNWCGCSLLISISTTCQGMVNLVVTPYTYIFNQEPLQAGDSITAFYDASAPAPLIFPPQYRVTAIVKNTEGRMVDFSYYDENLVNAAGTLQLNLSGDTVIAYPNGQTFFGSPADHYLLVLYSSSTRSVPALTNPDAVVVFCCA
ncbi:MAG TPA: hypothetical protein IAA17_04195 [Candidatus Lachnoclostridium stercorigallinarum]|uniref:Uncharacterized protein n=1 Tax=Candidatus Lachnoclostridium stercorigallinarum TaxID=2838634 RepID=A0A9D2K543_9FIRM|nr:hypothetical protein [Candidatus Lachnoclostridium stercorigallinarum]